MLFVKGLTKCLANKLYIIIIHSNNKNIKLTVHDMQLCCGLMFDSDSQFIGLLYSIHLPLPFRVKSPDHIHIQWVDSMCAAQNE